jgi:ectoine hydroxylase-related dioxygenase (phytanoyl-CoA dioxygenase family)
MDALMPGINTDPTHFQQEGYCLFRQVLNPAEVAEARCVLDAAIAATTRRPEYLTEPHATDRFWLELCCHPRVLDIVESVLGPDLILIMSHLIVKPPKDGMRVEWHQDNTTWAAIQGTDIVTVWLALDDADCGNGCMQVIPCSHSGYPELEMRKSEGGDLFGFRVEVSPAMEAAAVPVELAAGDASLHDSYILHGSHANTSDRRRAGYTMRYGNARTTHVDVDKHWVPVYLVRGKAGEGGDRYLDARPGAALPGHSVQE